MATRKNKKSKKSNKRFRKTRSKIQSGGTTPPPTPTSTPPPPPTPTSTPTPPPTPTPTPTPTSTPTQTRDDDIKLINASFEGNKQRVEMLLNSKKINPNPGLDFDIDLTPLFVASASGHTEIVKMLLKAGANVDTPIKTNVSPLWIASGTGHTEIVKILIKAGADVNMRNENDAEPSTPFAIAVMKGHTDVVRVLLNNGADKNVEFDNIPIIIWAKSLDRDEIVRLLIIAGANIESLHPTERQELLDIKEEIIQKKLMAPLVTYKGRKTEGGPRLLSHAPTDIGRHTSKFLGLGGTRKNNRKSKKSKRKTRKTRRK